MIARFVDITELVDHHILKFLFIAYNFKSYLILYLSVLLRLCEFVSLLVLFMVMDAFYVLL